MIASTGVAISTTGSAHRMGFLETAVRGWLDAGADHVVVTVDGDEDHAMRVTRRLHEYPVQVYRVGESLYPTFATAGAPRQGVAANKNTGIELLMDACIDDDYPTIEHLFLADDDVYPLTPAALRLHTEHPLPHSMVMWGAHRLERVQRGVFDDYAIWSWPRGVVLYARREVISTVGGMDERFGLGGHEHAEWSTRIHNADLTPAPFCSPAQYAMKVGPRTAMAADFYWHIEDMPRPGEARHEFQARKAAFTTLPEEARNWPKIHEIMAEREGDSSFVAFRHDGNGRGAATL